MAAGTSEPLAQRYFDQGMAMAFGFNAAESARFPRRHTSRSRMRALLVGTRVVARPQHQRGDGCRTAAEVSQALERARSAKASPRARALIEALSRRHPEGAGPNALDEEGYAKAMNALAERDPRDADVAFLAAESLMNLHPYDWWSAGGAKGARGLHGRGRCRADPEVIGVKRALFEAPTDREG